mmetsp:Transcript_26914/g.41025  ORF Transcript_26914/g.41025 Transcript_26914/m.41025 type:complete len:88 (-) Transcript_26914:3053-3316(-)
MTISELLDFEAGVLVLNGVSRFHPDDWLVLLVFFKVMVLNEILEASLLQLDCLIQLQAFKVWISVRVVATHVARISRPRVLNTDAPW